MEKVPTEPESVILFHCAENGSDGTLRWSVSASEEEENQEVEEGLGPSDHPAVYLMLGCVLITSPWELGKNTFLSSIPGVLSQNLYGMQLIVCVFTNSKRF